MMRLTLSWIWATVFPLVFAGAFTNIGAIKWNKISVFEVIPTSDSITEPRPWNGLPIGNDEINPIFDEAISQFVFMRPLGTDPNKSSENCAIFEVHHSPPSITDLDVEDHRGLLFNLVKCYAHGYVFYVRKNIEQNGTVCYSLLFPLKGATPLNAAISGRQVVEN